MKDRIDSKESIKSTKQGFEASFAEGKLYDRQTQDAEQLQKLIESLNIVSGCRILDLGTGTGYVALEIARQFPDVTIVGLDIVENALKENKNKAFDEKLDNVEFISYDGIKFPFEDNAFDIVVTRYALHHFPEIEDTFAEINRVLKANGQLFVSDPTPNDNDSTRFVDDFMRMKPDGHIKYYTKSEWQVLGEKNGLDMVDSYETRITFPRLKETATSYDGILKKHSDDIIKGYNVFETEDGKYIFNSQRVWNISFLKKENL